MLEICRFWPREEAQLAVGFSFRGRRQVFRVVDGFSGRYHVARPAPPLELLDESLSLGFTITGLIQSTPQNLSLSRGFRIFEVMDFTRYENAGLVEDYDSPLQVFQNTSVFGRVLGAHGEWDQYRETCNQRTHEPGITHGILLMPQCVWGILNSHNRDIARGNR